MGPGIKLNLSVIEFFFLDVVISTTVAHALIKKQNKKKTRTSAARRGARAAYHDVYPRDFGPRIAYTES